MSKMKTVLILCLMQFLVVSSIKPKPAKLTVTTRLMNCEHPSTATSEDYGTFEIKSELVKSFPPNVLAKRPKHIVESCHRKIYLNLEFAQRGPISGDDEYVTIAEVMDEDSNRLYKLLNPLMIKLHREQPQIIYPLQFEKIVNGGLSEDVIPIDIEREKRCDLSVCSSGLHQRNDSSASGYSEAFCCSCEESVPEEVKIPENKTPDLRVMKNTPWRRKRGAIRHKLEIKSGFDDGYNKHDDTLKGALVVRKTFQRPPPTLFFEHDKALIKNRMNSEEDDDSWDDNGARHMEGEVKLEILEKKTNHHNHDPVSKQEPTNHEVHVKRRSLHAEDPLRMKVDKERLNKVAASRQTNDIGIEVRRNCRSSSPNVDTAHCLKYSDLFYSVFSFKEPEIVQEISVQVFQKMSDAYGETWVDLTRGQKIRLGSLFPHARDKLPTISLRYSSSLDDSDDPSIFPINPDAVFVLIPSHLHGNGTIETHPEALGGPDEYLIISKADFSRNGAECDKIGSSFQSFVSRPDRCAHAMGSCLKRQPVDLWIEDMTLKVNKKNGSYFLENYGSLPSTELSSLEYIQNDFIALEFKGDFESSIEIEVQADLNGLIKKGSNVVLQSIVTDASSSQKKIDIVVINQGLVAGHFRPRIVNCAKKFSASPIDTGPSILIYPLHRNLFRLWIDEDLLETSVTCTVDIVDSHEKTVASRQMMIQKRKRCVCAFHCACQCVSSGEETEPCTPLMQEEYDAAGYDEDIPHRPQIPAKFNFRQGIQMKRLFYMTITFLLLFGKIKTCFIFSSKRKWIYYYGLQFLTSNPECGPQYQTSLKTKFVYFFANMFFFILYPLKMVLQRVILSECCPCCWDDYEEPLLKSELINPDSSRPDLTAEELDPSDIDGCDTLEK